MMNSSKRALRWAAPVALVGAMGLAACGDGSSPETARTASRSEIALGSDQHLVNQSEAIARRVRSDQAASDRLTAEAEQYERTQRRNTAASSSSGYPWAFGSVGQFDEAGSSTTASSGYPWAFGSVGQFHEHDSSSDEFVPGSRRMPL
jgi:hypothetical protein